jgi:hypothetical protein
MKAWQNTVFYEVAFFILKVLYEETVRTLKKLKGF